MTPTGEQLLATRTRCAQLVERLDIAYPFDVDDLRRRLERGRGKRIRVYDLPPGGREGGACGLLLPGPRADHLFVAPTASDQHRMEILTHELSHLVLGHAPNTALTDAEAAELVDLLLGGLDPRMVAEVLLSRTRYDHPRELETEVLASYLISVPRRRRRQRRGGPSSARLAADHLDAML